MRPASMVLFAMLVALPSLARADKPTSGCAACAKKTARAKECASDCCETTARASDRPDVCVSDSGCESADERDIFVTDGCACSPHGACACSAAAFDPDERTMAELRHLAKAIKHLDAAGFDVEARHIEASAVEIKERFLAAKIAEIRRIETCLAALEEGSEEVARHVELEVKFVDVSRNGLRRLGFDLPDTVDFAACDGIEGLIKALEHEQLARVISAPKLILGDGQRASIIIGEERPMVGKPDDRAAQRQEPSGTRVDAAVHVIDDGHVQLEFCPPTTSYDLRPAGGVPRRDARALDLGKTAIIGGEVRKRVAVSVVVLGPFRKERNDFDEVQRLFLVTPRLVGAERQGGAADKTATRPQHDRQVEAD